MLPWQEQDFLVAPEFLYVSKVLAVNPYTCRFFGLCIPLKIDLSHDLITGGWRSRLVLCRRTNRE